MLCQWSRAIARSIIEVDTYSVLFDKQLATRRIQIVLDYWQNWADCSVHKILVGIKAALEVKLDKIVASLFEGT